MARSPSKTVDLRSRSTARVSSSASRTRRSTPCSRPVGLPLAISSSAFSRCWYTPALTYCYLIPALAAAGEKPASVTDIFISHGHGDHIGGLVTSTGALAFPNATIHISTPEWNWLSGLSEDQAKNFGIQQVSALVSAIKPKVVPFAPGAVLLPGIVKAVELKGHTPGHSGFRIGSGADSVLVIGDAMHSSVVSVRKPSWQVAFDGDKQLGATTRAALVKSSAANGQRLYAEHFPFPGIGKIVKGKDGVSWQPESLH
jgi:glyoxylase-like metal-dependent hydrolase (beta-lactamase superfamily II)